MERKTDNVWFTRNPNQNIRVVKRDPLSVKDGPIVIKDSWPSLGPSGSSDAGASPAKAILFSDKLKGGVALPDPPPKPVPKVLKKPAVLEDEGEEAWTTMGGKPKTEKTEEELEMLREKRRLRRCRMKEAKKLEKQEKKRKEISAPKGVKIKMVDAKFLKSATEKEPPPTNGTPIVEKNLKFLDFEYPTLGSQGNVTKPKVLWREARDQSGNVLSDAESASEWETDVEIEKEESSAEIAPKIVSEDVNVKSILKSTYSSTIKKVVTEKPKVVETTAPKRENVKRSDPIKFDLLAAAAVKPAKEKPSRPSVPVKKTGNILDSSGPAKRRGKEREVPKKKRPSKMRKIILSDRAFRKMVSKYLSGNEETVADSAEKEKLEEKAKELEAKRKDAIAKAKKKMHSKKFQMYCSHSLSKELDGHVTELMSDLIRFQDRKHKEDPVKARAKRRYVVGLRETKKFLKVNKLQAIILATDVESVESEGGLNDTINELITSSRAVDEDGVVIRDVVVIFSMNRWKLGKACLRKVPISCIGILDYQGSEENFKAIIDLLPTLKEDYDQRFMAELSKWTPESPTEE